MSALEKMVNNKESATKTVLVVPGELSTPGMASQNIYTQILDTTEITYSEDLEKETAVTVTINDGEMVPVSETKTTERQKFSECIATYTAPVTKATKVIFPALFLAYVGYCMTVEFGSENSLRLLIGTILWYLLLSWNLIKKWKWFANIYADLRQVKCQGRMQLKIRKYIRWGLYITMLVVVGSLVGTSIAKGNFRNLVSLGGLIVFLLLLYVTSVDRSNISWHSVFWGFGIQFTLAILVLYTSGGKDAVVWCSRRLTELLAHSAKGSEFVFGKNYKQFYFAFGLLPKVIFFVAMVRVLTHLGVLSFINRNLGTFLSFCTGTSNPESICAAANVFVGGGQAILFIREYMDYLTESEIFCVFVGDLASIGGGAVVLYSGYGIPVQYLISASVLSAPAALAAAKLNYPSPPSLPKTDENVKKDNIIRTESNILHALSAGSRQGLAFVASILVNVMVLLAVLGLVDTALEWFGARAGIENLNFETISSYLFYPFAFLMGVDVSDCSRVSNLLGLRSMIDLTVAYIRMGEYVQNKVAFNAYSSLFNDTVFYQDSYDIVLPQWNQTLVKGILSDRSEVISAYALCGFASLSSLGISIGSISVLAPKYIGAVTKFAPRAVIVGTIACYFTACVAGMIYQEE
ncbi:solute carrier family 28 member 3-like [Mizuhopecten yessoensis]|uniref:Solute carrier family 28 member 3 n=1 Tax=Mizuhopecten yessoensis TaxID=6573 RepID=A0A210PU40_MIZYE|nr:solute carrier family 28 member 3-like [Mizuhopecten yessoensis]OWF40027.1 Solute carrier family 28 member 3 [Mizuhopecten yessoensis]